MAQDEDKKQRDYSNLIGEKQAAIKNMQADLAAMEKSGAVSAEYSEFETLEVVDNFISSQISEAEKEIKELQLAEYQYMPDEIEYAEQQAEKDVLAHENSDKDDFYQSGYGISAAEFEAAKAAGKEPGPIQEWPNEMANVDYVTGEVEPHYQVEDNSQKDAINTLEARAAELESSIKACSESPTIERDSSDIER